MTVPTTVHPQMSAIELWLGAVRQQCANEDVDYFEVEEGFWVECARGEMTPGEALAVMRLRN